VSLPRTPLLPESLIKVDSHLKELAAAAKTLNVVSDELTTHVSAIEVVLNKLNLGVRAHVVAQSSSNIDGSITNYVRLAYGKSSGKWGFVIEQFTDDQNWDEFLNFESWSFKDAPRELRIVAVDKIPELLEALVKSSGEIAAKMTKKVGYTKELAAHLASPSPQGSKK
jgi:hypothetical protein